MDLKHLIKLSGKNFLFWLSRKIDYPLVPPDVVQINFTFECNLRCKMCSMYERMKFLISRGRKTELDSGTIRKIIGETKELGTKSILFIGGEPLLRKDLFDLVEYAKSLGLGTVIVTNGVLLNEATIEKCLGSGVDWLSISIDAATEETFSKIRGEEVLIRITSNIELMNGLKNRKGKEFPKLVAVCTIVNDNLEELLDVVHLSKKLKIARVLFQPVVANNIDQASRKIYSPSFVLPERFVVLDKAIDGLLQYKKHSLENFDFIGNSIKNLELIRRYLRGNVVKPREMSCYAGYNRAQIAQEGKLYFCVNQEKYEANFGDIEKDSLKDLWFSRKAKFYRKLIKRCQFPCLQWCSYRDEFYELGGIFQKEFLSRY